MVGKPRSAHLMLAPSLIVIFAIVLYPLSFATYYSLRKVLGNLVGEWVGLQNYARMFADAGFSEALSTTLVFMGASTAIAFLAGLGVALLLSRPFRGRAAVTAAVLLPWIFPAVVAASMGRIAMNDQVGLINLAAQALGLVDGPILLDRTSVLAVAVLLDAWRTAPFVALILLVGLRTIPGDLYEAARVDGAGPLQRFLRVTLPLLKPALLVALLFRLLDAFRVYDLFWVMAGRELRSLSTYVYQNVMLSQINFGLGSAAAVFVFLFALSVAFLFVLILRIQSSTGVRHTALHEQGGKSGASLVGKPGLLFYASVGTVTAIFLAPTVWVAAVSLVPPSDLSPLSPAAFFRNLSPISYLFVLSDPRFLSGVANSILIAGSTTLLTLLLAVPAAYAVARLGVKYGNTILGVMLAVAFFPPVAVVVPMLVQLRELGLTNTHLGAIVPHTVFFLPFAIWLLTTFFRELPEDIEDAARVDGATTFRVLSKVILPLATPGVFASGALVFVLSWNEFLFARTFTLGEGTRPVTVMLADYAAAHALPPGLLAAASVLAALPPIALFLAFRRRILSNLAG